MPNKIEMVGKVFGRWTVFDKSHKEKYGDMQWLCRCICGNEKAVRGSHLRNGLTKSCGCLRKENQTRHGMYGTVTYIAWAHIIQRCTNSKDKNYHHYGGRGITVCEEWLNFEGFLNDMGECPKGLTIERKNNELGYFKENCCWDTQTAQVRNQRMSNRNKTGVRGVSWDKRTKKYLVQLIANGRRCFFRRFTTIPEAAAARAAAELKYWHKETSPLRPKE